MPLAYRHGHPGRAPRLPGRRRRLRRQPPGHRAGRPGPGALDRAPAGPHQRPRPDRPRAGRSTRTCSTPTTARCSTTSSCGGSTPSGSTSCPTPPTPTGWSRALGGADVTAERAIVAVQGPGARARLAKVAPEAAAVGRFRVRRFDLGGRPPGGRRHGLHRRGRRRGGRAGGRGARVLAGPARRRRRAGRARGPRHAAPGGGLPAPRPRAGPRHHAPAGRPGLGGGAGTRGRSGAATPSRPSASGASPAASGACWSRAAGRRGPTRRCCATAPPVGEVTSGNFSPVLGAGHRPRLPAARRRVGRPRWRSTCGARPCPPRSSAPPSSRQVDHRARRHRAGAAAALAHRPGGLGHDVDVLAGTGVGPGRLTCRPRGRSGRPSSATRPRTQPGQCARSGSAAGSNHAPLPPLGGQRDQVARHRLRRPRQAAASCAATEASTRPSTTQPNRTNHVIMAAPFGSGGVSVRLRSRIRLALGGNRALANITSDKCQHVIPQRQPIGIRAALGVGLEARRQAQADGDALGQARS